MGCSVGCVNGASPIRLVSFVFEKLVHMQDPVAIRLRHGALYGLPMALVAACWAACYASSAAGLVAAMHGASLGTKAGPHHSFLSWMIL